MILDKHWWRTLDGRLVPDGDIESRILAYTKGTELPDDVAVKLGILAPVGDGADGTGEPDGAGDAGDGQQEPGPADDPGEVPDGASEPAQPAEPAPAAPKQASRAADKAAKAGPNK